MADKTSITDLPLDILVLVFPYLDAKSFLSLCSTCKAFQQPSIRLDPAYWSFATRSTFRVPNQPVVQHDGDRWQKMYRRMFTQSHAFTWGNNSHSRLGHSYGDALDQPLMARFRRPGRRATNGLYVSFPTEMENTISIGIIADLQCGGWSTTLLNARGTLHTAGVLDGEIIFSAEERLQPLKFPPGYPAFSENAQYEEPTIAIRQFSAGRSHVLGLSDSGRIWSWYDVKHAALQIKFPNVELRETKTSNNSIASSLHGQVRQVVAGWSVSSAYIHGMGIVIWSPVARDDEDDSMDTMLVLHSIEVPKTAYMRSRDKGGESEEQRLLGQDVGVILNYVVLEHFVVLVTDIGKVFCGRLGEGNRIEDILELRALRNETGTPSDVQGSFRRFAIFKDGEVITSDQDYLEAVWARGQDDFDQGELAGLHRIPALQHNDVISVAFGDFHYLALHSDGRITSYGKEMGACGALGLGGEQDNEGRARSIVYERFGRDGRLLPHAAMKGRQVWFDNKKKDWLHHIMQGGNDPGESQERRTLFETDESVAGEVSEWIEQEARAWDKGQVGDDGLRAYFALRVSAAGWHSAAVVLVNEELANSDEPGFSADLNFPRLKLADGTEMSGTAPFDEWREGRPEWTFDDGT